MHFSNIGYTSVLLPCSTFFTHTQLNTAGTKTCQGSWHSPGHEVQLQCGVIVRTHSGPQRHGQDVGQSPTTSPRNEA